MRLIGTWVHLLGFTGVGEKLISFAFGDRVSLKVSPAPGALIIMVKLSSYVEARAY